jgi:murein DD-endopeptidase MepM/ murein hydrolase activator NlpD
MRPVYLILFFTFFLVSSVFGGNLFLRSEQVHNGEAAVLHWQGEPLSFGVVRFIGAVYYLYPDSDGAIALLPVGLDVAAGHYPIIAATVDLQGKTSTTDLLLTVVEKKRPEEHLTLPERMVTPGKKDSVRISREHNHLKEVFAGRSPRFWTTFERPVDDAVNSVFGKRRVLNGKPKSPHSGTDFRSPSGTLVRPISNGRVALVSDLFYTGNTVVVDHGEGLFSLYAHLSEVLVEEGHDLLVTDVLGKVGSTGRSTGAHLHLTVKLFGERIDPLALLNAFKD